MSDGKKKDDASSSKDLWDGSSIRRSTVATSSGYSSHGAGFSGDSAFQPSSSSRRAQHHLSQPHPQTPKHRRSQEIPPHLQPGHPPYNRVRVEDLLNDEPSIPTSSQPSSFRRSDSAIICHVKDCGRRFVSKESLEAHQRRSHAAATPFVCPHCHISYSTIPNLNKHVSNDAYTRQCHTQTSDYTRDRWSNSILPSPFLKF